MSDPEAARMMLTKAFEDFEALSGMLDKKTFSGDIFGFHAQQAIEKSLKAWLAFLGVEFPFTHDLGLLIEVLEENGQDVTAQIDLMQFNVYAVLFRYVRMEGRTIPMDRPSIIARIGVLFDHVMSMLGLTPSDLK